MASRLDWMKRDGWEANVEEGVFLNGQHVLIGKEQDHLVHADVHITSLERRISLTKAIRQDLPPTRYEVVLEKLKGYAAISLPHSQAHLDALVESFIEQLDERRDY
jgi:hypothetical protein